MKLSVVVPVYNEKKTITEILDQIKAVEVEKEIIVVDDHSTDSTWDVLQEYGAKNDVRLFRHQVNQGKGAAVRTGLKLVEGDIVIIQDADLEYSPSEYPHLLQPIVDGKVKVVYGSRFLGEHKAMYFWHKLGNNLLTLITNILYDTTLTDMETCYKVFTADIAHTLNLRSDRWGFDPEITAKILRKGHRIYEVPISYNGREFWEGKKISWRDGLTVFMTLIRYRFRD
ncbi:MAG: glycosyltransferase family 2 protein [Chloroflexi bacterium]|nr:glycosyltransferase family 2 protein [Chloroflexota bacterium]